jgi:hypothetical protein
MLSIQHAVSVSTNQKLCDNTANPRLTLSQLTLFLYYVDTIFIPRLHTTSFLLVITSFLISEFKKMVEEESCSTEQTFMLTRPGRHPALSRFTFGNR